MFQFVFIFTVVYLQYLQAFKTHHSPCRTRHVSLVQSFDASELRVRRVHEPRIVAGARPLAAAGVSVKYHSNNYTEIVLFLYYVLL